MTEIDLIYRQDAIETVHHSIFGFFDIVEDDKESPITEKDKTLLELNKALCNNIKALPSAERKGRLSNDLIDAFNQELAKISKDYHDDPENSHYYADILMVDTLKDLGFDVQPFEEMYRWYS